MSSTCPSCHQKRTLLTALHVAEEVCSSVAHRQVVLTIPKRLRIHTRFDRELLGKLSFCAWTCLKAEAQRALKFSRNQRVGSRGAHRCAVTFPSLPEALTTPVEKTESAN